MYNTTRDLLDAFKATPDTLAALLKGVSQKQAQAARGGEENWSVVQVLCHLRDAEEIGLQRDIAMRDQANPEIAPYDQEKLASERNYAGQELKKALADFKRLRLEHVALLEKLTAAEWERPGSHLEVGPITILGHILHMACHDAIHCAQIARQLNAE